MSSDSIVRDPPGGIFAAEFAGDNNRRKNLDQESYFNSLFPCNALYLEPGQSAWSDNQSDMIVATVGSGVVITIHDTELHMGAMGYVLLPDSLLEIFPHFDKADKKELQKAFQPIEDCVNHMKRHGAAKNRIRIRLTGGSDMKDPASKGTKNYVFVREYINRKGLALLNQDINGPHVRRVHFFPATGHCVRRVLRRDSDFDFMRDFEFEYQNRISTEN